MADDKKKAPPDINPLGASNVWEFFLIAGVLIAILSYFVAHFLGFMQDVNPLINNSFTKNLLDWFVKVFPIFKILSFFVSVLLVYFAVSTYRKLAKLRKEIKSKFIKPKKEPAMASMSGVVATSVVSTENKRWERVLSHIESDNPNDWKIAIIESDSILDEMVKSMGYHGDTLGERLKGIEVSDFNTLNSAWEAHKVRNAIAHEGANFQLNEREARRVIALYKSVFEEFKYI
jgi:hypothetical protein